MTTWTNATANAAWDATESETLATSCRSSEPAPLGSICSGMGGLELGIARVLPISTRWVADYEPPKKGKPQKQSAAKVLAHRFPGVPNLGDITIMNWSTTAPVKVICGGTPCQDVSVAGALAGMRTGTRSGIWSSMVEAINHHRPTLVVWENVEGALSAPADSNMVYCPICMGDPAECSLRALGRVVGDLSEIGYDAAWDVVAAADVGAPHRRNRVFVIAWPTDPPGDSRRVEHRDQRHAADPIGDPVRVEPVAVTGSSSQAVDRGSRREADADAADVGHERGRPPRRRGARPENSSHDAADADDAGRSEQRRPITGDQEHPAAELDRSQVAAHGDRVGREPLLDGVRPGQPDATGGGRGNHADVDWGEFRTAIRRWERALGRYAPPPRAISPEGTLKLNPAFVEWMQGLPAGWVTDVPDLTWNQMLHVLGNGVVPQQAAAAVEFLLGHAPAWVRADLGLPNPSTTDRRTP